jgi:hypothetical protein
MRGGGDPWPGRSHRLWRWRGVWLRWRWTVFPTAALASLVVGWWGFHDLWAAQGTQRTPLDGLYYALGLFVFEGGQIEGDVPLSLQAARFLAPLTLVTAAVGAMMAVFHRETQRFKARWLVDGHVVIVGLSVRGLRLARQLVEVAGRSCVMVALDDTSPRSTTARVLGVPVVTLSVTDVDLVEQPELIDVLEKAGGRRAESVMVMTGSGELNVRFAHALVALQARHPALRAFVEIDDVDGTSILASQPLLTPGGNVEWFSLAERAAKSLLDKLDALMAVRDEPARRHLVVVGRTPVGRSVVVQAARNWSRDLGRRAIADEPGSAGDRLVITLLDPDPSSDSRLGPTCDEAQLLHRRDPRVPIGASDVFELHVARWHIDVEAALTNTLAGTPTAVVITAGDEHELLNLSLAVTSEVPDSVPVWVCTERSGGLVDLVSGRHLGTQGPAVEVFHVLDTVLREDGIRRGVDEELARAMHQVHRRYRSDTATSATDIRTAVPWDDLDTRHRDLNLATVATWRNMLHEAGYGFGPYRTLGAEWHPLPETVVQQIAPGLHAAWNDQKKRQGYRQGVRKNDDPAAGPLTHPDIDVAFEELPSHSQQWNLTQAFAIPEHLAAAGLQLDPLPTTTASRSSGPRTVRS